MSTIVPQPRLDPKAELSENVRTRFYIDGEWVCPAPGAGVLSLISPDIEEPLIDVPEAGTADIDRAVAAAQPDRQPGAVRRERALQAHDAPCGGYGV